MANMTLSRVQTIVISVKEFIPTWINYLFILYAFAIPISGKLTNTVFTIIIILWILEGNLKSKLLFALSQKFVQALILFFLVHILWLWSSENSTFAIASIKNDRFLLYAIIYVSSIKHEFIYKILNGFIYAMMFSEITSYLIHFQIIAPFNNATISDPVPFALSHTTYALYLGISIGLMLFISLQNKNDLKLRLFYFFFFITASTNIFLISSRFGFILYATSIFIVFIYIYKDYSKKIILMTIPLIVIGYLLAYNFSHIFKNRMYITVVNTKKVIENKNFGTSLGTRVGNWYYSLKLIPENFFFGVGDGDQLNAFMNKVKEDNSPYERIFLHNLQNGIHTELMDIFVKFGLIGFLVYLNIYFQLYKLKSKEPIFNVLTILLIVVFLLSAVQGGAIILAVKDLGKIFTLLGTLILLSSMHDEYYIKYS